MTPLVWLSVVGVFATVGLITGVLAWQLLTRATPERRRLERAGQLAQGTGVLLPPVLTARRSALAERMASLAPRSPKETTRLSRRLARAGLPPEAAGVFTLSQFIVPAVAGLLALLVVPGPQKWLIGVALAGIGWLVPGFYLDYRVAERQKVIRNGLPDALDLLIVCLESGSALDQALLKVGDELEVAYPALAEELRMIIVETRAGKPRLDAFRSFSERTGVEDVRALVSMLAQTDRFGTSVSQALRTHADTSRTKRRQRAEERAAKIGVKLVFPLVFLLFPAFFTITLGPAVIRFVRVFFGQIMTR